MQIWIQNLGEKYNLARQGTVLAGITVSAQIAYYSFPTTHASRDTTQLVN